MCEQERERERVKWGSREREGEESDVYELREREREFEDCRKEGNGLRGRGFVWEFLTKKTGGFGDGKGGFWSKDEHIWYQKREDLGSEMQ